MLNVELYIFVLLNRGLILGSMCSVFVPRIVVYRIVYQLSHCQSAGLYFIAKFVEHDFISKLLTLYQNLQEQNNRVPDNMSKAAIFSSEVCLQAYRHGVSC